MRAPLLVLAAVLLVPAAALAEPLDLGDDAAPPGLETPALQTEDTPSSDAAKLGDLEDQVIDAPLALEPKFDLTAEQPEGLSGGSALDHTEPEPAPGIKLTIPTN